MRNLLKNLLLITVASVCMQSLSALAVENFTSEPVAEFIHLIKGPSGNTLVAVDTDGLILVEGVPAEFAAEYLAFVKKLTKETRILSLVNTHWHPHSSGLNATLAAAGVEIISHANTKQWLGATIRKRGEEVVHTPVLKDALPTQTFYDKYSIPFRASTIELGYLLHAHTDGDIYAFFPVQNILYTGPAVRTDTWSAVDETTNGFIGGLMDGLDQLTGLINTDTTIIPAGGPVLDKAGFETQLALYKNLMEQMVALLRQSRSVEEVVIANPAIGLKPEWGSPDDFLDQGFRSFYGHLRNSRHVGTMP